MHICLPDIFFGEMSIFHFGLLGFLFCFVLFNIELWEFFIYSNTVKHKAKPGWQIQPVKEQEAFLRLTLLLSEKVKRQVAKGVISLRPLHRMAVKQKKPEECNRNGGKLCCWGAHSMMLLSSFIAASMP